MDFFFFQAEDGIRDLTVTGVQTCALPISLVSRGVEEGATLWQPSWACPTDGYFYPPTLLDRKSTRLNSSHSQISYAVFCLKKKKTSETIAINTARTKDHNTLEIPLSSHTL